MDGTFYQPIYPTEQRVCAATYDDHLTSLATYHTGEIEPRPTYHGARNYSASDGGHTFAAPALNEAPVNYTLPVSFHDSETAVPVWLPQTIYTQSNTMPTTHAPNQRLAPQFYYPDLMLPFGAERVVGQHDVYLAPVSDGARSDYAPAPTYERDTRLQSPHASYASDNVDIPVVPSTFGYATRVLPYPIRAPVALEANLSAFGDTAVDARRATLHGVFAREQHPYNQPSSVLPHAHATADSSATVSPQCPTNSSHGTNRPPVSASSFTAPTHQLMTLEIPPEPATPITAVSKKQAGLAPLRRIRLGPRTKPVLTLLEKAELSLLQCSTCEKSFKSSETAYNHRRRVHKHYKPFICLGGCNKAFARLTGRDRHWSNSYKCELAHGEEIMIVGARLEARANCT
ncbi:hypothetical protein AURDEDRAFT_119240 [Auricularia subglabra TFB-10046 SS5]|nr:hypothetical protein AURDEDRAFT_119240 [Auricularia subglabra TFB-10046 SS5]